MAPQGHFLRNGQRQDQWGSNLSRALWYSSKGSGGTAKEGRLKTDEFFRLVKGESSSIGSGGRREWASRS